jgi:broad specificity phosphatase PhoE
MVQRRFDMSRLVLVRHAQASFSADPAQAFLDYDRLSDLGRRQAEALGAAMVDAGLSFDRVYAGPSTRHRETADLVGAVYARLGESWPTPRQVEGLAEHEGARVVRRELEAGEYRREGEGLRAAAVRSDAAGDELRRMYLTVFRSVTRRWARGELQPDPTQETWMAFRARVEASVQSILSEAGRGATVCAFTSGGPIGSTVAWALGLDDERAMELAWIVENGTLTELLSTEGRVSLKSFNVQPRLGATELITYV